MQILKLKEYERKYLLGGLLMALLGAAIAFRQGSHLGFSFIRERLPINFQRFLLWLSGTLGAGLFLFLIYFAVLQVKDEIAMVRKYAEKAGARCALSEHWLKGGDGALELADVVMEACKEKVNFKFLYPLEMLRYSTFRDAPAS
jgi:hypothetical protein